MTYECVEVGASLVASSSSGIRRKHHAGELAHIALEYDDTVLVLGVNPARTCFCFKIHWIAGHFLGNGSGERRLFC